jgi:CDP-glycerol glycerophosphotransferase (TagB/SpsB family)
MILINKLVQLISSLVTSLIKPDKVLIFCSYPSFTDNAFALYKYIVSNNFYQDHILVWIVYKRKDLQNQSFLYDLNNNNNNHTLVLPKNSLTAVIYYLKARLVFYTHGLYPNLIISRSNTVINLWHGMPLKRIALMDHKKDFFSNCQLVIATSSLFKEIMAKSFGLDKKNVLLVGQPRNDLLFERTNFFEESNINKSNYKKIGIWLPTFRASTYGDVRIDGSYNNNKISIFKFDELYEFDDFLQFNNVLLLIKLHPMDMLQNYEFPSFKNVIIIKQNNFNFQLYPLIGTTDFLLTDYSSVWVDYDILEKPIGFIIDDIEEYKASRGFTIDNLENELPGKIIHNLTELNEFILAQDSKEFTSGDRYNMYKDNNSCFRLLNNLLGSKKLD